MSKPGNAEPRIAAVALRNSQLLCFECGNELDDWASSADWINCKQCSNCKADIHSPFCIHPKGKEENYGR